MAYHPFRNPGLKVLSVSIAVLLWLTVAGEPMVVRSFRVPLEFQNQVQSGQDSALGWFYSGGRFLYPETRVFMRWHITDPVDLLLNVRAFYPIFHVWDGSGQPFWDALMVSGGIGFAIRLRPAAPKAAPK